MTDQALFDRVLARLTAHAHEDAVTATLTPDASDGKPVYFTKELAALVEAAWKPITRDGHEFCVICLKNLNYHHDPNCAVIALLKALDGEPT